MSDPRDVRAQADAILGNRPPPRTDAQAYREAGQRVGNAAKAGWNTGRAAGRRVLHDAAIDLAVTRDQPAFPHTGHTLLTILTVGLWGPVYGLHWLTSSRRRYQKQRRAELRRNGIS